MLAEFGIGRASALWMVMALLFILMLYRFNRLKREFNFVDVFMNYSVKPPRADLTSVIIFMMALMGIWTCVTPGDPSPMRVQLVLGVLGIFVLRQAIKIGADAYVAKPSAPEPEAPSRDVNVNVGPPVNPLAKSAPVPVQVANPEPIEVTQTPGKKKTAKR